jgi:hypothetical protein
MVRLTGDIKIKDLPKANSVGEFLAGAADNLVMGQISRFLV